MPGSPVKQLIEALMLEVGGRLQWPASFDKQRLKPGYRLKEVLWGARSVLLTCSHIIESEQALYPDQAIAYLSREKNG